jgi:transposase
VGLEISGVCGYNPRRLKVTKGMPKAITATARKIACLFYRMLRFGQEYVEQGMDYYEKKYQERVIKTLQKKAKELGYSLQQNQGVVGEVS